MKLRLTKKLCQIFVERSNRAIFNDLHQRPQTQISRSGHSLTLNISEMAKDTAKVTMEGETVVKLSNGNNNNNNNAICI